MSKQLIWKPGILNIYYWSWPVILYHSIGHFLLLLQWIWTQKCANFPCYFLLSAFLTSHPASHLSAFHEPVPAMILTFRPSNPIMFSKSIPSPRGHSSISYFHGPTCNGTTSHWWSLSLWLSIFKAIWHTVALLRSCNVFLSLYVSPLASTTHELQWK